MKAGQMLTGRPAIIIIIFVLFREWIPGIPEVV